MSDDISQLKKIYSIKKKEIISRLKEFEKLWSVGNEEEIFTELAFCILTPQSKAKSCWDAIVKLREKDLLLKGNTEQIRQGLPGIRFKNKKAEYIVKARKSFMTQHRIKVIPSHPPLLKGGRGDFKVNNYVSVKPILSKFADARECREWLVQNIDGLGYKEASHFLRNIGFGEKIAILDRHILRNLNEFGIIEEIPKSINRAKYMQIEKKMIEFSKQINIPLSHLDLLLWYKETGEIFK
jgi:N-glycosylase/DNA lyase